MLTASKTALFLWGRVAVVVLTVSSFYLPASGMELGVFIEQFVVMRELREIKQVIEHVAEETRKQRTITAAINEGMGNKIQWQAIVFPSAAEPPRTLSTSMTPPSA